MKLCFICCEYPPARHGGIGSVTRVLGRALAAAGHEVRAIGLYTSMEGLAPTDEDGGVQVWRLPVPPGRFGWAHGRRLLFDTVKRWAERGEIDLVEVPDWEGYAAGWPRLRVPVVVRLHGSSSYFAVEMRAPLDWPAWCLEAASFHRAEVWCSTSAYTAARTQRIFGPRRGKPAVLFNPVEVGDAPSAARDPNRVIFAGTLTPKKGLRPLFEAWPAVVARHPAAELHVFGKDEGMRDALAAMLPPDIAETVRFYGHVGRERVQSEFARARLAVFPSFAEAFSMVPLEAMAQGCPVVYSNRHSGPELIDHGRNGLLVDPARPEEIAAAVSDLLADDAQSARLGAAGRDDVARRFASDVLAARNQEFYENAIRSCR